MFDEVCENIPFCAVRVARSRERVCVCVCVCVLRLCVSGPPPCLPRVSCACVLPPCSALSACFEREGWLSFPTQEPHSLPACPQTTLLPRPQPSTSSPYRPHLASPAITPAGLLGENPAWPPISPGKQKHARVEVAPSKRVVTGRQASAAGLASRLVF